MQWIDEAGLETWAKRLDARASLPDMIADLIRASIVDASRFRFPGGDAAQLRGWDGSLETTDATSFVPAGKSKWEFGSGAGAAKASADYTKRTENTSVAEMAENTLVLVNLEKWDTPREQLTAWEQERRGEGKWRDVRYFDAVELVHWLDLHPATAALYARDVLQTAPKEGALSTDEFWEMYSTQFSPRLSEKVVIGDRQALADDLLLKLTGPPQSIMLGAETAIEVVAFAVAAIRLAKSEVRRALEVRTLIVESEAAARFLSARSGLTFIASGSASPGQLTTKAPTLSAATGVQARKHVALTRASANSMVDGFVAMGMQRDQGYELAHRCGRSLTILQRLIPNQPYKNPEWVQRAAELKPAFLAGGWSASVALDREVLKDLSGLADYGALEALLLPATMLSDPPIDRAGEYWQVRAPVDAFSFFGPLVNEADLQRLRDVAIRVFSHVVDAPSRDEKFSITYVSPADYSKWLRDGLALTLLLVATMNEIGGLQVNNSTPQRYVDEILNALPEWGKSHRTLIGLADQTALFAEAAPNPFLAALESMLEGDRSEIAKIFRDDADMMFGPSSPHITVLWALENLAWDPKLLNRTALVLARLAEMDPDPESRMVNRPINTLRSILLGWSPNTHATLAQRIACLDIILEKSPEIGWQLLVKLLPRSHDSSSPTQKPKLRDVEPMTVEELTFGLVWDEQHAVVTRAIKFADDDEDRVIVLVKECSSFQPVDRALVIAFIDEYLSRHQTAEESPVWAALRAEMARDEFFADSDWAMQEEERKRITDILSRYRPADPLSEDRQLFDDWLPYIGRHKSDDNIDPDTSRTVALERILIRDGPLGILKLTQTSKLPNLIGPLLDRTPITESQLLELLDAAISASAPGDLALYASAVGANRFGEAWTAIFRDKIIPRLENAAAKARLMLGWPLTASTWAVVKSLGYEVNEEYWRRTQSLPNSGPLDLLLQGVTEFRRMHRSLQVLGAIHRRLTELPTELIFALLSDGQVQIANDKVQSGTMLSYYLNAAFNELQSRADAKREDIARQEYGYFPLLSQEKRPLVLYEFLAKDPGLFVEVLSHVFRGKNAAPKTDLTEHERVRGHISYQVLSSFRLVPGAVGNVVDEGVLTAWVLGARAAADKFDLSEIADQYIGHVLANAPTNPAEDFWPPSAMCTVIEKIGASELENGFSIECFNKRGVVTKAIHEGGGQERSLALTYERWAAATSRFPRTSAMLTRISEYWESNAKGEDTRAELDKMKR